MDAVGKKINIQLQNIKRWSWIHLMGSKIISFEGMCGQRDLALDGKNHSSRLQGFHATLSVPKRGNQTIYIYAINVGGGSTKNSEMCSGG